MPVEGGRIFRCCGAMRRPCCRVDVRSAVRNQRKHSSRYWPGVRPVALRNARVKLACDPNPVSSATCTSEDCSHREHLLRRLDSAIGHVAAGRQAGCLAEQSRKMEGAEAGLSGEVIERYVARQVRFDEIEHALQPLRVERRSPRRRLPAVDRVVADEVRGERGPHAVGEDAIAGLRAATQQAVQGAADMRQYRIGEAAGIGELRPVGIDIVVGERAVFEQRRGQIEMQAFQWPVELELCLVCTGWDEPARARQREALLLLPIASTSDRRLARQDEHEFGAFGCQGIMGAARDLPVLDAQRIPLSCPAKQLTAGILPVTVGLQRHPSRSYVTNRRRYCLRRGLLPTGS